MIERIRKILSLKTVREKIFFTAIVLLFFRFITSFTVPGINKEVLVSLFSSTELLQIVNLLSGGLFLSLSVLSLGLGPYITASYIFQILAFAFPTIKEMFEGGPIERKLLTQYMRWATFPISVVQAVAFLVGINQITQSLGLPPIIEIQSTLQIVSIVMVLTFGAYITMWLGELITQYGVGGGSSLIIAVGILASFPFTLEGVWQLLILNWQKVALILLLVVITLASIVVTLAVRKVGVVYASRVRSTGMAGTPTEIFVPINPGGVMPVIFAIALISGLGFLARLLLAIAPSSSIFYGVGVVLNNYMNDLTLSAVLTFVLTVVFAYFSTLLVFNPKNVAENLQKQGAFIPGVRPGKETEAYLRTLTKRVVFIGGMLLALITVMPTIFRYLLGNTLIQNVGLGVTGTGILIVVSVVIDIIRQLRSVESTMINIRRYF